MEHFSHEILGTLGGLIGGALGAYFKNTSLSPAVRRQFHALWDRVRKLYAHAELPFEEPPAFDVSLEDVVPERARGGR